MTIWQRVGDELVPAASHPDGDDHAAPLSPDDPDDPRADLTVPAVHDGEVLGAISLARGPGDPVTGADVDLAEDAAHSLGLVLRNTRMTAELRVRVRELDRSRKRLLAAQDEARRQLERDIAEGPERRLAELGLAIADAADRARRAGVDRAAQVLGTLDADTRSATETLRDLARGIYPPLLESEGLVAALRIQAEKVASETTVSGAGDGRLGRDAEAALYFVALEALQNASKHAPGAPIAVSVEDRHDEVVVRIRDEGPGFAPERVNGDATGIDGMRDRLDAVRGRLDVVSRPGRGTTIEAAVPTTVRVEAVRS